MLAVQVRATRGKAHWLDAPIEPANDDDASGPVIRRERLGGLLNHYYREAA
jgi:hypothetical protein